MPQNDEQLARIEERLTVTEKSVNSTRKYVLIMLIGTICMAVLPIILGAIMLPLLMSTLGSVYGI